MAKSLADLRSTPPTERPQRSVGPICLRPDLVARVQALTAELDELPEPEPPRQRKMSEAKAPEPPQHPRAVEIRAELDALLAEMAEHEGEMVVRATLTDGEWRRWVDAHPPRPEGESGHDRDFRATGGICNADALIDVLGSFAHAWNGEELDEGDWAAVFEPVILSGDKVELARAVVTMYEGRTDFRQWRSVLSAGLRKWDGSASRETSGSAASDSTAGSREASSVA